METTENFSLRRPAGTGISNYPFVPKSLLGKIQEFRMLDLSLALFIYLLWLAFLSKCTIYPYWQYKLIMNIYGLN